MTRTIEYAGQAEAVMQIKCPLDRDTTEAEDIVLDAQDAAYKVMAGVRAKLGSQVADTEPRCEHSSKGRFRFWFDVRKNEICCFAILVRDPGTKNSYSDPLKKLKPSKA